MFVVVYCLLLIFYCLLDVSFRLFVFSFSFSSSVLFFLTTASGNLCKRDYAESDQHFPEPKRL
jgi:hypothetical protein